MAIYNLSDRNFTTKMVHYKSVIVYNSFLYSIFSKYQKYIVVEIFT